MFLGDGAARVDTRAHSARQPKLYRPRMVDWLIKPPEPVPTRGIEFCNLCATE
jgi:hypothetical protein